MIWHLNCGSMQLPGAPLVTRVLLLQLNDRFILIDSGFGLEDVKNKNRPLGLYRHIIRPTLSIQQTAFEQIKKLGLNPNMVSDIVVTHMDGDHIGGLVDFPNARVHVSQAEWQGFNSRRKVTENLRYVPKQVPETMQIVVHQPGDEIWFGFKGVTSLDDVYPGMKFVPLPGHTRGHIGVAIPNSNKWIFHVGDAFYYEEQLHPGGRVPASIRIQSAVFAFDRKQLRDSQNRIKQLTEAHGDLVQVICSHDPSLGPKLAIS